LAETSPLTTSTRGDTSATPTEVGSAEEVEEEEKEEEEDDDDFSKQGGRPREGEEWPDEEDVGRDTVDITNLVNKWMRPNLVKWARPNLVKWAKGRSDLRAGGERTQLSNKAQK